MSYSEYPESYKKASKKYLDEKVDSIMTRVPKGKKEQLQRLAEQRSLSLNAYMNRIIDYALRHSDMIE